MKTRKNEPTIRSAQTSEAAEIAGLINHAFQAERALIDGDRTNTAEVEAWFKNGEFLVCGDPGRLFGCVYLEAKGHRAYLGLLSVDPAHQGKGIGAGLMAAAEEWCRKNGCRFVDLRVLSGRQELLPFYSKLGYTRTGTSPMSGTIPLKVPCHYVHYTKHLG